MGWGGAKFRTWSGPGGSSHKGPLTSVPAYQGCFFGFVGLTAAGPLDAARPPAVFLGRLPYQEWGTTPFLIKIGVVPHS